MRVAAFTSHPETNASARYRVLRLAPRLAGVLGHVDVYVPDVPPPPGDGVISRSRFFARHLGGYLARARAVSRLAQGYDAILVQRGLYPLGPGRIVRALERYDGGVVYDLDDNLLVESPSLEAANRATRWLYGSAQARRLLDRADAVVVSTEELTGVLPRGVTADLVLPTVPDVSRYPLAVHVPGGVCRLGWVGNAGNLRYLEDLKAVLIRLAAESIAELEVVSSRPWAGPARFRPWTLEEEALVFATFDVGLMPLPDGPYTRAKAGFKLLQSMAAGVPVVASPVGVNTELVERSGAGILASSPADWERAIRLLAGDVSMRRDMGHRGRVFALAYADLDGHIDRLAGLLRGTASQRSSPTAGRHEDGRLR